MPLYHTVSKNTYIDKERNDQHHHDNFNLWICDRRENEVPDIIPEIELDKYCDANLHDDHKQYIKAALC
jgi:hypothetical protein